jgi:bifunctional non-homologous end joining protein LigD
VTVDNVAHSFVAGVRVSHPDRVIDPDLGISKIQLVRYFERIAD